MVLVQVFHIARTWSLRIYLRMYAHSKVTYSTCWGNGMTCRTLLVANPNVCVYFFYRLIKNAQRSLRRNPPKVMQPCKNYSETSIPKPMTRLAWPWTNPSYVGIIIIIVIPAFSNLPLYPLCTKMFVSIFQQTSGGTCLSTNWKEVKEKDYEKEKTAPDGMEWKRWDGSGKDKDKS